MFVIFDVIDRTFSIELSEEEYGDFLIAKLNRYGQTIPMVGVSFGYALSIDGHQTSSGVWPPPGIEFIETDQDILQSVWLEWLPDSEIKIDAWLIDSTGSRHDTSTTFHSPRPESPFPSWLWENKQWNPPVPRPEDDKCYEWDEENVNWLEVPCDPVPEPEPEIPVDSGNVINVDPIVLPDNLGNGTI